MKEMFGWFWIFVWIFMLIPASNSIWFSFTYVSFFTRTDSLRFYMTDMDFSPWKGKAFFVFQTILKSYFSLVKAFSLFNSCLDTFLFSL